MKANELQIGDWVKYYDCNLEKECYSQVTSIQADCTDPFVQTSDSDIYYLAKEYRPIPLTKEILKLNGFLIKKIKCELQIDNYTSIELYKDGVLYILKQLPDITRIQIKIEFVHELQHVLRLCGLLDLAENFKIE